jgi:hypothetical protein
LINPVFATFFIILEKVSNKKKFFKNKKNQ